MISGTISSSWYITQPDHGSEAECKIQVKDLDSFLVHAVIDDTADIESVKKF
jgi:hypothetical protein